MNSDNSNSTNENLLLNVAIIQIHPTPRDVEANIKKVEKLLKKYSEKDKIDVVLMPEMVLTGYIFDNKEDIAPYLEEYNNGKTFDFCARVAKQLKCYVFCGYPEKSKNEITGEEILFNSCMIVDKEGNALPSYRKHFLYEMDKTWCVEGQEFGFMELDTHSGGKIRAGIGICMDLNPYEFTAPWEDMEFSTFCLMNKVDVILFLTNWLDNEPEKKTSKEILHMITYWVRRLEPFQVNDCGKPVYFLAANRCGKERDTNFIGCSCAVKVEYDKRPILLENLDKNTEACFIVNCLF